MAEALQLGRYSVFAELASGGMATVYLGRMSGAVGFGRTVAIKRLHPHLARDPDFVSMFLDEARLAARVTHPNVVPTLDVVTTDTELFLVMEYVKGETLGGLLRAARHGSLAIPIPITLAIVEDLLNGLHAAHEARDEQGAALDIVHRDVSPQNVIVGVDGVARVLDFGVAKAATRLQTTREGQIKGKVSYMAPEQIHGLATRRSDIYAAGVVLWEALSLRRLFTGDNEAQLLHAVLMPNVAAPSTQNPAVTPELDAIVMRALASDPAQRFATAREMAEAIDACMRPASSNQVAQWLESMAGPALQARRQLVAEVESHSGNTGRSEVRKFIDLGKGPAALLASESGPQVARKAPSVPSSPGVAGTASAVTVAFPTGQPPVRRGRALKFALAGAGVTAVGGVALFLSLSHGSPPAGPGATAGGGPAATQATPPAAATKATQQDPGDGGTARGAAPAESSTATPTPTPIATSTAAATPNPTATSNAAAAGPAHPKKANAPAPKPKQAPPSPSDINSLLDSH